MKSNARTVKQGERGYALLLVFVLAASIAIGLYMEVPRVAFESQRAREQMLIDRGNEYKRAVQVYFRKFKAYPTSIDDLESKNNMRFLRHRYSDPMTGKDDWRLIHMGPGGVLTDSLVQKPQTPQTTNGSNSQTASNQTGTTVGTGTGTTTGINSSGGNSTASTSTGTSSGQDTSGQPTLNSGLNMAVARRPSDHVPGGLPGQPGTSGVDPQTGLPIDPTLSTDPSTQSSLQSGQAPISNAQPLYPGQPGYPAFGTPGNTGLPIYPGQPGYPTQSNVTVQNGINPTVQNGQAGSTQGQGAFGNNTNPAAASQSAVQTIGAMLTSPNQNAPTNSAFNNNTNNAIGAGVAGVASKYDGEGIKRVGDRSKYKEWEFVYDFKNDRSGVAGTAAAAATAGPTGLPAPGTTTNATSTSNNQQQTSSPTTTNQ